MARTGFFHHVGTFLLFAAAILLLITTISAPVIHDIALLKVTLTNSSNFHRSEVSFGTFGHCILNAAPATSSQDWCTKKHVGYNPAQIISGIDNTHFNTASTDTSKALTRVMILHPIACGLAFIAFLLALGSGVFGALLASLVSALTWIITVVVMATDFVLFGIVKNHINRDGSGSHAKYSVAMWTILAAMILLFFATFIVFFTCFSARLHSRRDRGGVKHDGYVDGPVATPVSTRRHFWQRRARY